MSPFSRDFSASSTTGTSQVPLLRALIVAASVPESPLTDGYRLHVHHLVDGLRHLDTRFVALGTGMETPLPRTGHGIRIVPHRRPLRPAAYLDAVESWYWRDAATLAPALVEEVEAFAPDVVHAVGGSLAPLERVLRDRVPAVLGALDAAHLNLAAARELARLGGRMRQRARSWMAVRSVRRHFARFDRVVLVSEEDAAALHTLAGGLETTVIPNGVDADLYAAPAGNERVPNRLLFTGALVYPPNAAAARYLARELLPAVRTSRPEATLQLVGRDPSPQLRALGSADGVAVIGPVPDMVPYLSAAAVYVCPMISGTGIKNKLLEAMANGLPCVATPLAVRGLDVRSEEHLLIGESVAELTTAVLRLLDDGDLRQRMGAAGRAYVRSRHSWRAMAVAYQETYEQLTGKPPRAMPYPER